MSNIILCRHIGEKFGFAAGYQLKISEIPTDFEGKTLYGLIPVKTK